MKQTIVLWCTPRSASTAFEKAMMQRHDTSIVHEPFTDCYYFGPERRSDRYGDEADRSNFRPDNALDEIRAVDSPIIFVKELAFQAAPYIDQRFLQTVQHAFLLGRPEFVCASLRALKPDFTEEEFGFTALEQIYSRAFELGAPIVSVLDTDTFRKRPEATLHQFCRRLDLDFQPTMLRWSQGAIRTWRDCEDLSQKRYHRTLESSTGIFAPEREIPVVPEAHRTVVERAQIIRSKLLAKHQAYQALGRRAKPQGLAN